MFVTNILKVIMVMGSYEQGHSFPSVVSKHSVHITFDNCIVIIHLISASLIQTTSSVMRTEVVFYSIWNYSGSTMGRNLSADAGDAGSIPRSGRSPGGGNGNPLQYPCLGNPMAREVWRATVHGSQTDRQDSAQKQQHVLYY